MIKWFEAVVAADWHKLGSYTMTVSRVYEYISGT